MLCSCCEERHALNRLWKLVNDRFNYLTPTKKPVGWGQDKAGRRKRLYDKPQSPLDRHLGAGALAPAQERELIAYRDQLNLAAIAREIADIQAALLILAKEKTDTALPRHRPDRPTRRPQRHPDQGQLTPGFADIPT